MPTSERAREDIKEGQANRQIDILRGAGRDRDMDKQISLLMRVVHVHTHTGQMRALHLLRGLQSPLTWTRVAKQRA